MPPELLAPAGTEEALRAALAAGADAVYFGLDEGFNARARARNFPLETLPDTVARVHRAGARAYLTVNTLVFEQELEAVEALLRAAFLAGIDSLIVQDPATALIARAISPAYEVHASTQMTIASPAAAAFARNLGINRVVVPRELSLDEIRRFRAGTELELEVFVHGALCMSWSGQCLTSEAWGGRSANRGQCAQSCRLPYGLLVDGRREERGELRYLLSPKDLAGLDLVEELAKIGVHGLKIEGRQKSPAYVGTAVSGYRSELDRVKAKAPPAPEALARDLRAMALSYSRGFGHGFLDGSDHQRLVDGRYPKHRGIFLGAVVAVRGWDVEVEAPQATPLTPGMGVVFDAGHPEDTEEPGGPIFRVERRGSRLILGFGRPGPDLSRVSVGDRVWATRDIDRPVDTSEPEGRIPLDLVVEGRAGEPLRVRVGDVELSSESPLGLARGAGLGEEQLRDKLGGFGGTIFRLASLDASGLEAGLHLPISELKGLRRQLVARLTPAVEHGEPRVAAPGALARVVAELPTVAEDPGPPQLLVLCRTPQQLEAVIAAGLPEVELDWMELVGLQRAVDRAREAGLKVRVATLRVTKPGEEPFDDRLLKLEPDSILVRHWAALERFRGTVPLHGDFSLNVTNSVTARLLLGRGLETLTASFDLDEAQLGGLLSATPASRVTVMLYHRIPTFHTEHCLYAHLLSAGKDYRDCGRPCEQRSLSVLDPEGREHPVIVDAGCRNTVFNHVNQSAALAVPGLLARGVRRFRIQLVREDRATARRLVEAHLGLIRGACDPSGLIREFQLVPQLGVASRMSSAIAGSPSP